MKARIMMLIMAVALVALPAIAQDWQSTSAIQGSGSTYSSQVTAVGATGVSDMATTTESYSPAKAPSGRRKIETASGNDAGYQDPGSPIGDAWSLALFAVLFAAYIAVRKHSINLNNKQ